MNNPVAGNSSFWFIRKCNAKELIPCIARAVWFLKEAPTSCISQNEVKKTMEDGSSSSSSSSINMDTLSNLPEGVDMLHNLSEGVDMLSNLPEGVKEKVLSYLPIKDAVKTIILSGEWRYTWASIPELVVCDAEVNFNDDPNKVSYYRLIEYVDTMIVTKIRGKLEDGQVCKMHGSMVNGEVLLEESLLSFNRVESMELRINFEDEIEAAFVLALFEKASQLQSLVVHVDFPGEKTTKPTANFWDSMVETNRLCKHLKTAHVDNMKVSDSINSFLRFILVAPKIKKMVIGDLLRWPLEPYKYVLDYLLKCPTRAAIDCVGRRY